jgi:hypothetical protein
MVTFYNYFVKCGPKATVADVAGKCDIIIIIIIYHLYAGYLHLYT